MSYGYNELPEGISQAKLSHYLRSVNDTFIGLNALHFAYVKTIKTAHDSYFDQYCAKDATSKESLKKEQVPDKNVLISLFSTDTGNVCCTCGGCASKTATFITIQNTTATGELKTIEPCTNPPAGLVASTVYHFREGCSNPIHCVCCTVFRMTIRNSYNVLTSRARAVLNTVFAIDRRMAEAEKVDMARMMSMDEHTESSSTDEEDNAAVDDDATVILDEGGRSLQTRRIQLLLQNLEATNGVIETLRLQDSTSAQQKLRQKVIEMKKGMDELTAKYAMLHHLHVIGTQTNGAQASTLLSELDRILNTLMSRRPSTTDIAKQRKLTEQLSQAQTENQNLTSTLKELRKNLKKAENKAKEAKAEKDKSAALRGELEQVKKANETLVESLRELREMHESRNREQTLLRAEVDALKNELERKMCDLNNLDSILFTVQEILPVEDLLQARLLQPV